VHESISVVHELSDSAATILYWKNQVASKSMIITGFEEKGSQVPYIRYHIEEKRLYKREGK